MNEFARATKPSARWRKRFRQITIGRLRVVFVVTGSLLLGSVLLLGYFMHERLRAAQREREEMIASRVFDELEREVSAFLETENERARYEAFETTDPERWAPFVVGYFKQGPADEIVSADGLTSENRRRMVWALAQLKESIGPATAPHTQALEEPRQEFPPQKGMVDRDEQPKDEAESAPKQRTQAEPSGALKAPTSEGSSILPGSKIIESLNRAPERRKQQQQAPKASSKRAVDPFSDYAESY